MNAHLSRWGWVLGLALGVLPVLVWGLVPGWQSLPPGQQALSLGEQAALVLAVYGFKPVYMLLSLGILFLIWSERGPAWLALQASMGAFLLGEFFCWINILFFVEEILVLEYLHSLLMVFCLGFLYYSIMEVVDKELLHFSDPHSRCALANVCKGCVKARPGACLLRRLFQWMIPLAAVVAFMPLMAQPLNISFETLVFGMPRALIHLMPIQWYELRFSPIAALALMAGAWLALGWRGGTPRGLQISKILLSAAIGHLGFALMRLAFAAFYREALVWFIFWEELTELLLVLGVLVMVLLIHPARFTRLRTAINKLVT